MWNVVSAEGRYATVTFPVDRTNDRSNEDEAAQAWLTVLRDGTHVQKIQAREHLASIFERRRMHEEAIDLLISNVRQGVRNADIFRWLARLHRAQGDEVMAMQAAAEAAKYLPPKLHSMVVPTALGAPPPAQRIRMSAPPRTRPAKKGSCLSGCMSAIFAIVSIVVGGTILLAVLGTALRTEQSTTVTGQSVASRVVNCDFVLWHDRQEMLEVAIRAGRDGGRNVVPTAVVDAVAGGRATLLPSGTRVRVSSDQRTLSEARVEVVEGPYARRTGWTTRPECVGG